jgi:hypothetical protein
MVGMKLAGTDLLFGLVSGCNIRLTCSCACSRIVAWRLKFVITIATGVHILLQAVTFDFSEETLGLRLLLLFISSSSFKFKAV